MARNLWRPDLFSAIHCLANSPDWISARIFLHFGAGLIVDDARAAGVVAVFGGVADAVAHVAEAAFLDEVHDEFEFVEALEVGDLGGVAGFDQSLETRRG